MGWGWCTIDIIINSSIRQCLLGFICRQVDCLTNSHYCPPSVLCASGRWNVFSSPGGDSQSVRQPRGLPFHVTDLLRHNQLMSFCSEIWRKVSAGLLEKFFFSCRKRLIRRKDSLSDSGCFHKDMKLCCCGHFVALHIELSWSQGWYAKDGRGEMWIFYIIEELN